MVLLAADRNDFGMTGCRITVVQSQNALTPDKGIGESQRFQPGKLSLQMTPVIL